MNTARLHHYIPRCYLKGFTHTQNRQGKLFVLDAIEKKSFSTLARNIAAERDFNRIDADDVAIDALESQLSKFDGQIDAALGRIIKACSIKEHKDREAVINFIAMLAIRNPRWREQVRQFHEDSAKRIMDISLATKERWESQTKKMAAAGYSDGKNDITYEEMKDFHERGEYKIELHQMRHHQLEFPTYEKLVPIIGSRKWTLIKAPEPLYFITSDHPVCLYWNKPEMQKGFYSPGFGLGSTDLIFPISRNLCLRGTFEEEEQEYIAQPAQVGILNGIIAAFAQRQVYAADGRFIYVSSPDADIGMGKDLLNSPLFQRNKK